MSLTTDRDDAAPKMEKGDASAKVDVQPTYVDKLLDSVMGPSAPIEDRVTKLETDVQ